MSISTHVLDARTGTPAVGMDVRLERLEAGTWTSIRSGITNADGRCPLLTEGLELEAASYRMRFHTGDWFAARSTPTFYPVVEITFQVADPAAHFHVPLLLSPFAYSTYRGS